MKKIKIMFVIHALTKGGAERVITNLANSFAEKYEVSILAISGKNNEKEYELKENVRYIETGNAWFKDDVNIIKRIANFVITMIKARKKLKQLKPDVIVAFIPKTIFKVLVLKPKNTKVIISGRNNPEVLFKSKLKYFLMKLLYNRADGFIYQTLDEKKWYETKIKKKGKIILNSINPDFIVKSPYAEERKKEIVSVGRLSAQKNFRCLIRAFNIVVKKHPEYKMVVYGEGEERTTLEKYIEELDLNEKVILPGKIMNVKEKIYDSKAFVLSSNFEGMPNALIEAMTLGIPCISTNCPCGGPKELIKNDINGILVETNDYEAIATNLVKIIEDDKYSEKLSNNAIKIGDLVHPDIVNKQWEDYILEILRI